MGLERTLRPLSAGCGEISLRCHVSLVTLYQDGQPHPRDSFFSLSLFMTLITSATIEYPHSWRETAARQAGPKQDSYH